MSMTVNNTFSIVSGALMIFVCDFLLLVYRGGLEQVLVFIAQDNDKKQMAATIHEVQKVGQQYLLGMSIMIVILSIKNSIILIFFWLEHSILFALLAALLAIVPDVGTTLGAAKPVLFVFFTKDSIWILLGIAASFWFVQLSESNVLSPKIVGTHLRINALTAIIALFIGGYLWGIIGMALFLPLTASFRVFCKYFERLKPIAMLMSDDLYKISSKKKVIPEVNKKQKAIIW